MAQRIRYISEPGVGTFVSARWIPIKDGEARVTLSPHTKEAFIHLSYSNKDIRIVGTSLHKLKIAAKNELIKLGAEFAPESRTDENDEPIL